LEDREMSEELWASRNYEDVHWVKFWDGELKCLGRAKLLFQIPVSVWNASPDNPRIEPGDPPIQLDPSSFVVTARAKPEERWWLIEDHGKDPYVFRSRSSLSPIPSPQTFSQSEAIGLGLFQLYDIVPSLGRPFVRDITHKVKAARAAGGTE
jgi:hypothetical protein